MLVSCTRLSPNFCAFYSATWCRMYLAAHIVSLFSNAGAEGPFLLILQYRKGKSSSLNPGAPPQRYTPVHSTMDAKWGKIIRRTPSGSVSPVLSILRGYIHGTFRFSFTSPIPQSITSPLHQVHQHARARSHLSMMGLSLGNQTVHWVRHT